jgi:hypothetical protein
MARDEFLGDDAYPSRASEIFPNASKALSRSQIRHSGKPKDYAPGVCDAERQRDAGAHWSAAQGKEESPGALMSGLNDLVRDSSTTTTSAAAQSRLSIALKKLVSSMMTRRSGSTLDVTQEKVPAGYERTEVEITWL